MTELISENTNYIIKGIIYTKEEILKDEVLKMDYLDIIKYNKHKEKSRILMKLLRQDTKYKEQNKLKVNTRYAEDPDYRAKKLEKSKQFREKKALLDNKPIRNKRGRPKKYTLNDNLECILLCN